MHIFYNGYGGTYARRYEGQIVRNAFLKVCLVLIFLNTIVEKTYLEITILHQFHDRKVLFKVPKICNANSWIENDPPPPSRLALFQKFIRFGTQILPLGCYDNLGTYGADNIILYITNGI